MQKLFVTRSIFKNFFKFFLLFILFSNPFLAAATTLTSDQTFFDPWEVPLGIYSRDYLYPASTGNSIQWDGNIVDVDILPMLKPYLPDDPAGYPAGYDFTSSDYYYIPLSDYIVDLSAGVATATFSKSGIYHARLTRDDGTSEIRAVLVNAGTLGGDNQTSASVSISGPVADLVVVSKPTKPDETLDIANANAVDDNGESKVSRANSAEDAVTIIKEAFIKNDLEKIHLEIVAHGAPGYFELGDTAIGPGGSMTMEEFQVLIDKYVNEISIYACSFTGDNMAGLQTLADSIGYAWGFDKPVSVHRDWLDFSRGWDLSLNGKLDTATAVPEPASIFLIITGAAVLGSLRRKHEYK